MTIITRPNTDYISKDPFIESGESYKPSLPSVNGFADQTSHDLAVSSVLKEAQYLAATGAAFAAVIISFMILARHHQNAEGLGAALIKTLSDAQEADQKKIGDMREVALMCQYLVDKFDAKNEHPEDKHHIRRDESEANQSKQSTFAYTIATTNKIVDASKFERTTSPIDGYKMKLIDIRDLKAGLDNRIKKLESYSTDRSSLIDRLQAQRTSSRDNADQATSKFSEFIKQLRDVDSSFVTTY